MNKNLSRGRFLLGFAVLFFCFSGVFAQTAGSELTLTDKRQIIEVLLKERFNDTREKTIYISTNNLSEEMQRAFPVVKNKKIQFVSGENSSETGVCAFEFGNFETIGKFVSVSFGNCNEGLAYDFKKYGDKWKSVGLNIIK